MVKGLSLPQWGNPVNHIAEQAVSADQVLKNFILAIHRGNPKQTPYSLATFSHSFALFPFQKIKTLPF